MQETAIRDTAYALCQAYERGSVDAVIALMDPEVVAVPPPLLAQHPYQGHAGIRQFFDETAHDWDAMRFAVHRIGVTEGRALLLGRYRAGRGGALRDGRIAWVVDIGDAGVERVVAHGSWEAALAETGLGLADTEPLAV